MAKFRPKRRRKKRRRGTIDRGPLSLAHRKKISRALRDNRRSSVALAGGLAAGAGVTYGVSRVFEKKLKEDLSEVAGKSIEKYAENRNEEIKQGAQEVASNVLGNYVEENREQLKSDLVDVSKQVIKDGAQRTKTIVAEHPQVTRITDTPKNVQEAWGEGLKEGEDNPNPVAMKVAGWLGRTKARRQHRKKKKQRASNNYFERPSESFWIEFNKRKEENSKDTIEFKRQVKVKSFLRKGKHGAITRVQSFRKKAAIRGRNRKDHSKRELKVGKRKISLGKRRVLGEGFQGKVIDYKFNTVRKQATPALFRNTKWVTKKEGKVADIAGKAKIGPKIRKVGPDYIDMEKLKGKPISKELKGASKRKQRKLGTKSGKAVAKLHEAGIQHRDLHLDNLYNSGGVKVIDYGFARKKRKPLSARQGRIDVKRVESKAKQQGSDEFATSFRVAYEKNRKRNFSRDSFWLEFNQHKEENSIIEFARRKGKPLSAAHKAKISRSLRKKHRHSSEEEEEEENKPKRLEKIGAGYDKSVDRVNKTGLAANRSIRAGKNIGQVYRHFKPRKKSNLEKTGDALNVADKFYRRGIAGSNQANKWTNTLTKTKKMGSTTNLPTKTLTRFDKTGKVIGKTITQYTPNTRSSTARYSKSLGSQAVSLFTGRRR